VCWAMRNTLLMRHSVAWVSQTAVASAQYLGPAPLPPEQALAVLGDWLASRFPLIVARQVDINGAALPSDLVRVGLAEPLAMGKRRLAFLVPRTQLLRVEQGPTLAQALPNLPAHWQAGAAQLDVELTRHAVDCRLYGSAAIDVLTGLKCLHDRSDLDLVMTPKNWSSVTTLCTKLHELSVALPGFKVDGEVRSPLGCDVHWLELFQQQQKVLAKSLTEVQLLERLVFQHQFSSSQRGVA
jgi:phosphoribosyl-dephospho-CoA transferase